MTEKELARQRTYRLKTGNASTKRYEKTVRGFLMRLYRNMTSRITGVQRQKWHLYKGKELLDKEAFYNWSLSCNTFFELFKAWTEAGYPRKLTPSVDRINPDLGYTLSNIRWVTHSENSRNATRRQTYD